MGDESFAAYHFVDAFVSCLPAVFVLSAKCGLVHAVSKRGTSHIVVSFETVGWLHHEASHELVVFMIQEMTVINVTGELDKLVFWYVEVGF